MISKDATAEDLLRHLGLTGPIDAGYILGVQITKEQDLPMTVHVRTKLTASSRSMVVEYQWSDVVPGGAWIKKGKEE